MDMESFAAMVRDVRNARRIAKGPDYTLTKGEQASTTFRRSLFAVKDIKAGELFTTENVRSIRPSNGLKPKYYRDLLGKTAKTDIPFGTPLTEDMF
jgi:sialic acid synthase SpsE